MPNKSTTPVQEVLPPVEKTEAERIAELEQYVSNLEAINRQVQEQANDLNLHLEVANERWVELVNKNAALEVQVRKLSKKEQ